MEKIRGAKKDEASENKPIENRMNPKPPNFKRIPAKITEPEVGASLWASGNQTWKGTSGILTAKDKKKSNPNKLYY
jgi:hypothetical protein